MSFLKWSHAGFFAGGMLFASKGIELLTNKKAHDVYVKTTAMALRGRDEVLTNVTAIREGCEDIYAEAVQLNEERAELPKVDVEVIEDKSTAAKAAKKAAGKSASAKKTAKKA